MKKTKRKKRPAAFSGSSPAEKMQPRDKDERLRDQIVAMGVMAQAIHAQGERDCDYTERLNKKYGR